jgi:hypothetical protein
MNAQGGGPIVQADVREAEALRDKTVKYIDANWEDYSGDHGLRLPKQVILDAIRSNERGFGEMERQALGDMYNSVITVRYVAGAKERDRSYSPKKQPGKQEGPEINLKFGEMHYDVLLVNK